MALARPNSPSTTTPSAKPFAAQPQLMPVLAPKPTPIKKDPVAWASLSFPAAALATAGLLNLAILPPLLKRLNKPPSPSNPSATFGDIEKELAFVERLDVSRHLKTRFRELYRTRPYATNTANANADGLPAEKWLRDAAEFYDRVQAELFVVRLAFHDYSSDKTIRLSHDAEKTDEAKHARLLAALHRAQGDPQFAPHISTNASFQPYSSLSNAWPNITLRLLISEFQEIDSLHNKKLEQLNTPSFLRFEVPLKD